MSLLTDNERRPTIMPRQTDHGEITHITYVFDSDEKTTTTSESILTEVRQWFFMSLVAFSFGVMLGWPSPNYPILLDPGYTTFPFFPANFTPTPFNDTIDNGAFRITMIQSPLVAGLLMIGAIFATPFSSDEFILHSVKHGVLTSLLAMTLGWLILWQSSNVYHLLISRFIIGLGYGYAVGQLKNFINGVCPWLSQMQQNKIKGVLLKMINVVMILGVLCAYVMGTFLNYRNFAIGAVIITVAIYFLVYFGVHATFPLEEQFYEEISICTMLRTASLRRSIILLITLTFVQQFTGVPATIVYSQLIMLNLGLPTFIAPFCSIIYILIYLFSYILGSFYFSNLQYHKRLCVLLISLSLTICSLAIIIVIQFLNLREICVYIPFCGMCLYIFVNGMGLGCIPNGFSTVLFPQKWRRCANDLQFMCFLGFAVIITKLFQVFFGEFPIVFVFVLFLSIACFGMVFVVICIPRRVL